MAITVTSLVGNGDKTASASLAVTLGATGVAVGETILVGIAADNAGTSGVNSISSVTDSQGNTYTQVFLKNQTPGAAANDGTTVALYVAFATTALVANTDSVTVNFSPNTTAKAFWVSKMAGGNYNSSSNNTASGAGTAYTSGGASASITSGDVIFGVAANESGTAPANDTDTTNGSWTQATQSSGGTGLDSTKQAVGMSWKVVTATGAQTFNGATGANTDWAAGYAIFPAKVTTTISPAAGSLTLSGQTPTTKLTLKPAAGSLTTSLKTPVVFQMPIKPAAASLTTSLKTPTIKSVIKPAAASLTATPQTPTLKVAYKPVQASGGDGNAYQNYQTEKASGVTSVTLNWNYGIPKIGEVYWFVAVLDTASNTGTVTDNAGNSIGRFGSFSGAVGWATLWRCKVTKTVPAGSTWSITLSDSLDPAQNMVLGAINFGTGVATGNGSAEISALGNIVNTTSGSITYSPPSQQKSARDAVFHFLWIENSPADGVITSYPSDSIYITNTGATDGFATEWGVSNNTNVGTFPTKSWTFSSNQNPVSLLASIPFSIGLNQQTPTLKSTLSPAAASLTATGQTPVVTVTGGGNVTVTPAAGSLNLDGKTPTLTSVERPAAGSLTTSLSTPTLTLKLYPAAGSLTLTASTPDIVRAYAGSDGATAGGAASASFEATYSYVGFGGATAGGAATTSVLTVYTYDGSGGATAGGAATTSHLVVYTYTGAGGATAGGAADTLFAHIYEYAGSGGATASGAATTSLLHIYPYAGSGGATASGAAGVVHVKVYVGAGGATAGGTATIVWAPAAPGTVVMYDVAIGGTLTTVDNAPSVVLYDMAVGGTAVMVDV